MGGRYKRTHESLEIQAIRVFKGLGIGTPMKVYSVSIRYDDYGRITEETFRFEFFNVVERKYQQKDITVY